MTLRLHQLLVQPTMATRQQTVASSMRQWPHSWQPWALQLAHWQHAHMCVKSPQKAEGDVCCMPFFKMFSLASSTDLLITFEKFMEQKVWWLSKLIW